MEDLKLDKEVLRKGDIALVFNKNWEIRQDAQVTNKDGKVVATSKGLYYYSSFPIALERYAELVADKKNLAVYVAEYKEIINSAKTIRVEVEKPSYDIQECLRLNGINKDKMDRIKTILEEGEE